MLVQLDAGVSGETDWTTSHYVQLALSDLETREDDDFLNLWDERIDLVTRRTPQEIGALERWSADRTDASEDQTSAAYDEAREAARTNIAQSDARGALGGDSGYGATGREARRDGDWRDINDLASELQERGSPTATWSLNSA